jgi:LCP family protein required for cell wall assembly
MKPTEITPLGGKPKLRDPDRLTEVLIWASFFIAAALAALATDLWAWPASDGQVVQAVEPSPTDTPAPTATPLPAMLPDVDSPLPEATITSVPPTEAASPTPVTPPPCVPPTDWGIHIVQEGNTLFSLARRYGTDVDTLMRVNCLNTYTIFVGQHLYAPGPFATPTVPTPVPTATAAPTHTPRPGASATPSDSMLMTSTSVPAPTAQPTATPKSAFRLNIPNRYLNIVLLGSDRRPNSGAWRTDSMIVVSVDTETNLVRLLSIPRDLWVYIPGHGYNRINTADLWGELQKKGSGPDRVKQTIHHNLGIPIHYYVRVDFQGFIEIIDAVGGVNVDVECPLPDINLTAGIHHMDGKEALRYSRSRKSTSDFDRGRRQRKVLMALWDQALTLDLIPKLPSLWRAMDDTFQTDLPLDQVINLAYVGVQLKPQHILSRAIGSNQTQSWITPQGAAVLLPREGEIRTLLEGFYAPVDKANLDAVDQVRVRILNGSQQRQAAELATASLGWDGFKVVDRGLADRQDYAQTQIQVYTGNVAAAEKVARQLKVPLSAIQDLTGLAQQPDPSKPVDIHVILGRDYDPCQ